MRAPQYWALATVREDLGGRRVEPRDLPLP